MARGGPGGFDVNALMKQAQQMQDQMLQAQEKLKEETVEASAGGGMVKVTVGGDMTLRAITNTAARDALGSPAANRQSAVPMINTSSPSRNSRRRPYRSASVPAISIAAVSPTLIDPSTQVTATGPAASTVVRVPTSDSGSV